jgi:hypothetical protein
MQVFGGHGFIKEWGMEQYVRDNRINMIYEGTNTIQSLDLLGRKVLGNNGATLKKFGKLVTALVMEEGVNEKMAEFINPLAVLGEQITKFTMEIGRSPGVRLLLGPHGAGVAAEDRRGQHRPVLHRQAADRALLLRQAVPRDRDADAHRARRQQGADGHRRRIGLIHVIQQHRRQT